MLGYISSTRRKSCFACVKSKRRCDLRFPFCKRCSIKGLDCKYPNAAPRESSSGDVPAEVVICQPTPDISIPENTQITGLDDVTLRLDSDFNTTLFDPFLLQTYPSSDTNGSNSSPESQDDLGYDWGVTLPPPAFPWPTPKISKMLVPDVLVPVYMSQAQRTYIVRNLSDLLPALAYTGSTTFLHQDLYHAHQPQAYQDSVALSALYLSNSQRTRPLLGPSISTKIANLAAESSTWTLPQHLAAVQALIIYQIIRLFDPSLKLQALAEHDNRRLELWAALLWKRFFNDATPHASAHDAWIFAESLRRTIIMSVFVRCSWSMITKDGMADQVAVLARLPLARNLQAWEMGREQWAVSELEGWEKEGLVNYADFAAAWSCGSELGGMDPFARLLLGACRGKEDERLLIV